MDDIAGRGGPAPPATIYGGALGELDQIDQAVYRAIAATPSSSLDFVLSRLSSAADHSKLWLAVAAALALKPGRPRRAALLGVASIGLASATANLAGKGLLRRARPDRAGGTVPAGRKVRMPGSTSFPQGIPPRPLPSPRQSATSCPWPGCRCTPWPPPSPTAGSTPACTIRVMCSSARSWEPAPPSPSATPAAP